MINFPDIAPEVFTLDFYGMQFSLRWYAVSYLVAFFLGLVIMRAFVRRQISWKFKTPPMELDQVESLVTYLILGVILGGRLGYVLFYNLGHFLDNPSDIVRVWDGGMSFHGGFLGVIVAVMCFCRYNGIPLMSAADLVAVATPPGLLLGRVANFINAELWGRPTNLPWGIVFPGKLAQDCPNVVGLCARHPSQLYEAGLEGLLLGLILIFVALMGGFKQRGLVSGIFFLGYGASRCVIELFRQPDIQFISEENPVGYIFQYADYGITMGQALSLPMILIGLFFILIAIVRTRAGPKFKKGLAQ
ncbi:prolipoprotein diacylglyceryl transferase [Paracoccaceae bacterium]|nr:prolipoprotein diacylglyceryl transferase [Paracoccaceae bacterium]